MKKGLFLSVLFFISFALYAGDVSNLVILGFSKDGSKFAFGMHGIKDQTYQAYAEIYLVDATTNDFLEHGVFRTSPTRATYAQDSKTVFLALQNRAAPYLKKYGISDSLQGRPLYSQREQDIEKSTLIFRDFETNSEYTVFLHSNTNNLMQSSFYITCDVLDASGVKYHYKLGHPEIMRAGIKSYAIKKVIIDPSSSTLVFIIEKKAHESSGDSIRYMAEVIKF